jgi:predicted regulator of Ras-like GTPase activity (Roadblock/LC7/MglB family)
LLDQRHEGTGIAAAPPPPALESATAQPAAEASTSTPDRAQAGQRQAAVSERASAPDWLTPQPPAADFPFAVVTMPTAEPVSEAAMSEVEDAPLLELDMVVEEPPAELELPETEPTNTLSDEEPWAVASMVGLPDEASEPDAAGPIIRATDPNRLFDALLDSTPLVGALLLDKRGLVLAGALGRDIGGRADDLGAIIGGAIDDAARTVAHLAIGDWRVMLLESETAVVHVSPIDGRGILVLAARRDAPTGWLMRTAAHAVEMATRFLEAEQ